MSGAPILIAGAGIAGLTAALALARHNIPSRVYEREAEFSAIGAGVQLSPNATRLLEKLGALDFMLDASIQPSAVIIKDAASLHELARVPLGAFGERRWRAPYLVVHRADLQQALLNAADRSQHIEVVTGARIREARARPDGVSLLVEQNERSTEVKGLLAIGADGVWSDLRAGISGTLAARFSGEIAWRATLPATNEMGKALGLLASPDMVTTFIHPHFHLVCYPINTGRAFNLVAVTGGLKMAPGWTQQGDVSALESAMAGIAEPLAILMRGAAPWTVWPLHQVSPKSAWSQNGRLVLIGDAAHAMTPFAAQGAAMAIEDAAVLASCISAHQSDLGSAVAAYETARRPRLRKVAARGRFNRFAWHARWPISMARNFVLARRDPERLAADLDWLYGWQPESL